MVFEFFKGGADHTLEEIEATIAEMLLANRHTFDLAINTVLGGTEESGSMAEKAIRTSEQIRAATGVDLIKAAGRLGGGGKPPLPPPPGS